MHTCRTRPTRLRLHRRHDRPLCRIPLRSPLRSKTYSPRRNAYFLGGAAVVPEELELDAVADSFAARSLACMMIVFTDSAGTKKTWPNPPPLNRRCMICIP